MVTRKEIENIAIKNVALIYIKDFIDNIEETGYYFPAYRERLEAINKEVIDIVNCMSHDLRNEITLFGVEE
jgi:hypothetical protein